MSALVFKLIVWAVLAIAPQIPASRPPTWTAGSSREVMFSADSELGLLRSTDGGRTWQDANRGLPPSIGAGRAAAVVTLSASPREPRIVYCATEVDGIFRSEDAGQSWTSASAGLPVPLEHVTRPPLLAIDDANPWLVYAVFTIPVHSHLDETRLYRSSDGGRRWSLLKELPGMNYDALSARTRLLTLQGTGQALRIRDEDNISPEINSGVVRAIPLADVNPLDPAPPNRDAERKRDSAQPQDDDGVAILHDDGGLLLRTFSLSQRGFQYRPTANGSYDVAGVPANIRPDLTTLLTLTDDGTQLVTLPFPFRFYGRDHTNLYVNANGNVTFGSTSTSSVESSSAFFSGPPRIAPLWDDLNPETGGGVYTSTGPQSFTVTWSQVPEFLTTNSNTFQLILFADGTIEIQFGSIAIVDGLTGISNGSVTDGYYVTFDDTTTLTGLDPAPIHELFSTTPLNASVISRRFYQSHEDEFDALFVFGASELPANLAGPGATAFYASARNDVRGIGISIFDVSSSSYGSGGRLQGYLNMNSLSYYPSNFSQRIGSNNDNTLTLFGQEWGHRFLAFARFRDNGVASAALLGRGNSHWNYFFNSEASVVEGNQWRDDGNGVFTNVDDTQRFGRLDQYLMGLRDASGVPPLLLITNPEPIATGAIAGIESTFGRTDNAIRDPARDSSRSKYFGMTFGIEGSLITTPVTSSGYTQSVLDPSIINTGLNLVTVLGAAAGKNYFLRKDAASQPQSRYFDNGTARFTGDNIVVRGSARNLDVSDIIAQEGLRSPSASRSQKHFRHAFILVVPRGRIAAQADITKLAAMRRAWESFYPDATEGTSTVSTSLDRPKSNDISNSINSNGVWVYSGQSPSSTVTVGSGVVDAGSDPVAGVAIFASRSGSQIVSETAVAATGTLLRARFYAERTGSVNTGFAVTAPGAAAVLTLELRNAGGAVIQTQTLQISAGGHTSKFITDVFQNVPSSFTGSVTIAATAPVAIVALRTILNELSEFLMTTLPVTDLNAARTTAAQTIPQLADGGGYVAEIQLVNPGDATLTGTVDFFSSPDGSVMSLAVDGVTRSSAPYSLAPHAVQILRTAGTGNAVRTGYLIVRPSATMFPPVASVVFTYRAGGLLVGATGVGAASPAQRMRIYFDRTAGHDTGIALVNPGAAAANLQLTFRTNTGAAIPAGTQTLSPAAHSARFVSQIGTIPPPVGIRGTLEIVSDVPIAAIALRTTQAGNRFLLSTLPIIDMDRLPGPQPLFFPHRAHGGGYTTEYILINASSAAVPVQLSLVSP